MVDRRWYYSNYQTVWGLFFSVEAGHTCKQVEIEGTSLALTLPPTTPESLPQSPMVQRLKSAKKSHPKYSIARH